MSSRQSNAPEFLDSNATSPSQTTVFRVLAAHARAQPLPPLVAAAILGIVDATMIARANSALWWLAAGFVSFASYGSWALADRMLARGMVGWRREVLRALGATAIGLGCFGALAVMLGFMRAALAGWIH